MSQRRNKNRKGGSSNGNKKNPIIRQNAPVSKGTSIRNQAPIIRRLPNGKILISHREYWGDVVGSTSDFSVQDSIPIQPGLYTSFPWLSPIANQFESYEFRKLTFCYETESATSQTGYVVLAPDFDPNDSAPASKANAMQYQSALRISPWTPARLQVRNDCLHKRKTFFTRAGGSPTELSVFDVGNLFICVGGNVGATTLGEIWMEYEIELSTPQVNPGSGCASCYYDADTPTPSAPCGSTGTFTFGSYEFLEFTSGTTITLTADADFLLYWQVGGVTISALDVSSSGTSAQYSGCVTTTFSVDAIKCKGRKGDILTFSVTAASVTYSRLRIASYNYDLS